MVAGSAATAPVPSHANAAVSSRPKRQSHWCRTRARRTPGPGIPPGLRPLEAERPVVRELRRETGRRSDGDAGGRATLGPRARPARAVRERRGRDLPRPRATLGQDHELAYPVYPSRHFRFVREYQYTVLLIHQLGIKCHHFAGLRRKCVYRTDKNGSTASMEGELAAREGPKAAQRPGSPRSREARDPGGPAVATRVLCAIRSKSGVLPPADR